VRVMHVAVVVAMLGIVVVLTVVSVGVVVHLVHPLHFTRAGQLALAFWANLVVIETDDARALRDARPVARTAKAHRPECLRCKSSPLSLVGSLTRSRREFIDAYPCGCQHRTSFPFRL
jgi:hypothetical protein